MPFKKLLLFSMTVVYLAMAHKVYAALPGPHSSTVSGDVFLGGDYIELGISQYGSFGTDQNKPTGFYGTAARNNIGMSSDLDGFDSGTDWRMDFFMPGTQEERWSVGYKIGGTPTTAANARRASTTNITNNVVTNQSAGDLLKATSIGTVSATLKTTQVISFNKGDKFFKNVVTLENVHASSVLDSVRYMRSFDPDNTVDKSGSYTTRNTIVNTHAAGDGKAVVQADTSNTNSDPVYTGTGGASGGTRSPIFFYSTDTRARVNYHSGLNPGTVYASGAYDTVNSKGSAENRDGAISIAVDVGTLNPGQSSSFTYYTSLDDRDFSEVEQEIEEDEAAAPVVTESDAETTENTATISWTTDIASSSQVEYGLVSSYGFTTTEADTSPRVTNHEVLISGLKPCARYFYRTKSTSADDISTYSEQQTFKTKGCAIAAIDSGSESNIASSGGSLSLDRDTVNARLDIPANFHSRTTFFQINKLTSNGVSIPDGKKLLPGNVFDLIAVDNQDVQISTFDTPVTFVVNYEGLVDSSTDENSLDVYKYVDGNWVAKNCTLNTSAKTLTCSLSSFSVYAVLGATTGNSNSSSNNNNSSSAPTCENVWLGKPDLFQIDSAETTAKVYFTPVAESNEYYISYSTQPNAEEHGVLVNLGKEGVQQYEIKELLPYSTYYFKVRSQKGCVSGDWSNIRTNKTVSPKTVVQQNEIQQTEVQIDEPESTPTPATVSDITETIEPEKISARHKVLLKVKNQGKPVAGVEVKIKELEVTAITNKQGEVIFEDVEAGKRTFSFVQQAFAAEKEIEVTGDEKEFDVLVQLDIKQNLLPDWVWIILVLIPVGLLILIRVKRYFKKSRK